MMRATSVLLWGALTLACTKQRVGPTSPAFAAQSPDGTGTHYDPIRGCCGRGPWEHLREAQQQADFEIARLDAQSVDWSVYAHHPNPYVRGLSLLRLREHADTATDAQVLRVAELLSDGGQLYSEQCAALLTTCEQGQGVDLHRGLCQKNTRTVAMLADHVLALVPPDRVVRAMVAAYADPSLADLTEARFENERTVTRLRVAALRAPLVLSEAVAERLPKADAKTRSRLLQALLSAPIGAAAPRSIEALEPLLNSKDPHEARLAAAAIVRLTDREGPAAAAADREPRMSAVALLSRGLERNEAHHLLVQLGPSASPLLDRVLTRMNQALASPTYPGPSKYDLEMIGAIGSRADRATAMLVQVLNRLTASTNSEGESQLGDLIRTLGAVSQHPEHWVPAVLRQVTSRELFVAATAGLQQAKAKLSAEQLDDLKSKSRRYCEIPRHPRAFDGSWDDCFDAQSDLERLEKRSLGEPVEQSGVVEPVD